ncbi:MAG: nucleoside triphosphate pyrophosphohydrolase [Candidatus Dormibacteraeota bacterium]|nr:nucleoside triphosphate pyrophosphohydrolase [Candidatus Dormibacteraeota bacterium]
MPDQAQDQRPYPPGIPAVFEVVRRLRAPDGCPWDREQTHRSLRPYLLEETYEVLETLDRGDGDEHLREELGDVLLQVAMHAAIAEEEGRFTAADVSEGEAAKMVSRHPHVFGDVQVSSAEEVLRNWEARKAADAAQNGMADQLVLDRVPSTLPALAWTYNMQKRAARVGFEAPGPEPVEAVEERAEALRAARPGGGAEVEAAVGDLLLAVVTLARALKVNPEDALRASGRRYRDRFARMDAALKEQSKGYRDLPTDAVEEAWAAAAD